MNKWKVRKHWNGWWAHAPGCNMGGTNQCSWRGCELRSSQGSAQAYALYMIEGRR